MPAWVTEGMYPNDPDGQRRAVLHWHHMQRTGWTTAEERADVRRRLWPCTDQARDLIQEALSAAFQYGEMPPIGDPKWRSERQAVLLGVHRDTKFKLVRYVAELEKMAGIPGAWTAEGKSAEQTVTEGKRRQVATRKAVKKKKRRRA